MLERQAYKPVSDYGVVGDLRTVALVGRDGSIDWCCFPRLDKESVFGSLLDSRRGGRFRISLSQSGAGEQSYVDNTNVLTTRFSHGSAALALTDFMPVSGNIHGHRMSFAPGEIHRMLRAEGGDVDVRVEWSPRFDYGRAETEIRRVEGGWVAQAGDRKMSLSLPEGELRDEGDGPFVSATVRMKKNSRRVIVARWGTARCDSDHDHSAELLDRTIDMWEEWAGQRATDIGSWAGRWGPLLIRSELLLKLLSHADTGAIAAAPTTSLPECIGGVRNWDYRYTWIRDASVTGQALASLGHFTEAREYLEFLQGMSEASSHQRNRLQVLYGLHGETDLEEENLPHWDGYRRSAPVRFGNQAAGQFQMGIHGELLNTAFELESKGRPLQDHVREFAASVADDVAGHWDLPDHGIWEMRGGSRHFVYSKVMAWLGLDRAVKLSRDYGLPGDPSGWKRSRDAIREQVLDQGFNRDINSFVISYGSRDLDAANLRIPLLGFLPFEDPRVQGTINSTMEQLMENGLVRRYRIDDGLPGREGAFNLCTFWLVDVLALSGRVDEAVRIFEGIASRANHCGLLSEEIDPETGEFLGNFPQAFSHVGLINSAINLARAQGREAGIRGPGDRGRKGIAVPL